MDLEQFKNMNILMVTPNSSKMNLLKKYSNELINIKYMTKEEFKSHYFYSYDNKTISYLITKYNWNLDVVKVYLNNLYVIDIIKDYSSDKLIFLQELKKELINNNLLYFDKSFSKYLSNKKVIIYKYDNLEKYEEEMFSNYLIVNEDEKKLNKKVVKCSTLEDEVLYVINSIISLIKKGVDLNNIYLSNVGEDYLYTIERLFNYFNIPINIDLNESIYGTKFVKEYLKTKKIPSFNNRISTKLISVINSLTVLEDDSNYDLFLLDKLKHTYLKPNKYKCAVNIINYKNDIITDDDYLFVLGFNQDIIPTTYKDEDYISDNIKDEVSLYKTVDKNIKEKKFVKRILGNIKNLYISYKEKSNFNSFLPSVIIEEESLLIEEFNSNIIYNSDLYNKLLLGSYLDNYYKYGEINKNIGPLLSHYNIPYNTYDNKFTGISNSSFLNYINNSLRLSYTSLNTYNNCAFKYYINYILKINKFSDTFSIFIGNLFHNIFSVMYTDNFNFSDEWNKYLENRELSLSELFFLNDLKKKLLEDIEIIKNQELLSNYHDKLCEEEINVKLDKKIDVIFTGKIDKIIYNRNVNDTYFSLIDYKTGNVNTSINNMKYGLDMQLPIYLYLFNNSKLFDSPIFTGMYFQRVLYPSFKWEINKSLEFIKKENLKLLGYSTSDTDRLYEWDKSYENSELIKSMKINKDMSFYGHSKVLNDLDIYNILEYTKEKINKCSDNIISGDFSINPKVIDKKKSCEHCSFRDICFVNNKNFVYLDSVDDLDYLGGDDNGN